MYTLENSSTVLRHFAQQIGLLLIFGLAISCTGQKKDTTSETGGAMENAVEQESKFTDELMAQEKKWASALVGNDMKTVAALMHRDFRLKRVYGDALPISKEMYLGMPGMSAEKMDVTHFEILEELGDIVIAKTAMSMDWQQEGVGKLPPYSVSIDIWQRNADGSWQVLSRVSQILDEPYSSK
ncbi:MAG: nuclear transport factor 2 family protein [Bacteroidota bacterium]